MNSAQPTSSTLSAQDIKKIMANTIEQILGTSYWRSGDKDTQHKINFFIKNYSIELIRHSANLVPVEMIDSWSKTVIGTFMKSSFPSHLSIEEEIIKMIAAPNIDLYNEHVKPYIEKLELNEKIDIPPVQALKPGKV